MTSVQSVELMAGLTFFVFGLSYLFHTDAWAGWYRSLSLKPSQTAIGAGMAHFIGGAFILSFHWIWTGSQALVTAIGMLMALEGLVYLLCPQKLAVMMKYVEPRAHGFIKASGILITLLAIAVLYNLVCGQSF